jgi:very-short-patch-repair endonuclease
MAPPNRQNAVAAGRVWQLARKQHGVISRPQLLELGLTRDAIKHRLGRRRLHRLFRGVYAVGRPELSRHGWWMAAVLSCGPGAVLSHTSAAALWAIRAQRAAKGSAAVRDAVTPIHVTVGEGGARSREGIRLHRRGFKTARDVTRRDGIPVTSPAQTLIDLATVLGPEQLEAAVNEADKLGLIDPEALREAVDDHRGLDGVAALRKVLDDRTFALTDSELERRFLRLVRRAGLPPPKTRERVNGFRVDFFWPELGLVVETDGLRYHRTPAQQAKDRVRDQAHIAAGLTPLRFTHGQIAYEAEKVVDCLIAVAHRLRYRAA